MSLNLELARKVLQHAEASAKNGKRWKRKARHDQVTFYDEDLCGTTACLSGLACILDPRATIYNLWANDPNVNYSDWVVSLGGKDMDWAPAGQKLLGLTPTQADSIFWDMDNASAIGKLRKLVEKAEEEANA